MSPFSVRHIDYLEGRFRAEAETLVHAKRTEAPAVCRRTLRITRVGKFASENAGVKEGCLLASSDLMVGMYAYKIPLSLQLGQDARGISLRLGVWSGDPRTGVTGGPLDTWLDVLKALLAGAYPGVEVEPAEVDTARCAEAGAIVLGIPSFKTGEAIGGVLPIDRLFRAMGAVGRATGHDWSALVLAEPIDEGTIEATRDELLAEFLETRAGGETARVQNPMTEYYMKLLDIATARAVRGLAEGAWRVAVYLSGDPQALARLASVWKSIFQGEFSVPQPVVPHTLPEIPGLAARWALPDVAAPHGPGLYTHPFAWQSFLTSRELAAYVHLPERETKGLAVRPVTYFNVVANAPDPDASIEIGEICELRQPVGLGYRTELKDLRRHGLIVGMTGSGKTNTVKRLLSQLDARGVPFLVIEPAKKEYRDLLRSSQFSSRLTVWTIGDETCAPLRLNPFEFEPGIPVASHIDLLKSLFTASFGLWTPLPQILERCLHEIYQDRGWVVATGENRRLAAAADVPAFPTLSELVAKVETVTQSLGYHGEFTSNARAALQTRINSLCSGGKGRMLDVRCGVPIAYLLDRPTVLELENIGDDDDKAFFIGLMLLQLAEHRRAGGAQPDLRHMIVFEEAHRLFSRAGPKFSEEQASPRAKAVETFANMLAEVRAYGQGVLIADQTPTKLAPDVIKNTGLKICHRLVDGEERTTMAAAMAMNQPQATALSTLRRDHGEAIVFGEGDETPFFVSVPLFAPEPVGSADIGAGIAARWSERRLTSDLDRYYLPLSTCVRHCRPINGYCHEERQVAGSPAVRSAFESLVLSLVVAEDAAAALGATEQLTDVIARRISAMQSTGADPKTRLRCVLGHAAHGLISARGRDYGWDHATTATLIDGLVGAMTSYLSGPAAKAAPEFMAFGARYAAACAGPGPFRQCREICGAHCLFRFANRDREVPHGLSDEFAATIRTLPADPLDAAGQLAILSASAADELLSAGAGASAAWRAGACFALHQIDALAGYRWDEKTALAETYLKLVPAPREEDVA